MKLQRNICNFTGERLKTESGSLSVVDRFVWISFLLFSFGATAMCMFLVDNRAKQLLFVLPMSYMVCMIFFKNNFKNITLNIPKLVIEALYFVRNTILPMMYCVNSEYQLFEGKKSVEEHFLFACLLMAYECIMVHLAIFFYARVRKRNFFIKKEKVFNIDICKYLIIFLVGYIVVIALFLPQYGATFKNVFQLNEADFTVANKNEYMIGSFGRVLRTLYSLSFQLIRILFPAYLMRKSFERKAKSKDTVLVLIVGCFLQFMFLTATFAEAIIACLTLILYYVHLYPYTRKKLFVFLISCTAGMFLLYFGIRYTVGNGGGLYSKDEGIIYYATEILNAYFTGVDNVAAMFNVPKELGKDALKADIIRSIPFNSTLFGDVGKTLQQYYNEANLAYGQIPPTIGCGFFYFGGFLAPIISVMFVVLGLRYNEIAERRKGSLRYVSSIYCSIVFSLGTVMCSWAITLQLYFSCGLFLLLITRYSRNSEKKVSRG